MRTCYGFSLPLGKFHVLCSYTPVCLNRAFRLLAQSTLSGNMWWQVIYKLDHNYSENMYRSVHYIYWRAAMSVHHTINMLLSIFKATVVKPLAHCRSMGNFYSLITTLSLHQLKWF